MPGLIFARFKKLKARKTKKNSELKKLKGHFVQKLRVLESTWDFNKKT